MRVEAGKTLDLNPSKVILLDGIYHIDEDKSYYVNNIELMRFDNMKYATDVSVVIFTVKGKGRIKTNKSELVCNKDTIVYLKQREIKEYKCDGEEWEFWWFEFFGEAEIESMSVKQIMYSAQTRLLSRACLEMIHSNCFEQAKGCFSGLLSQWEFELKRKNVTRHSHITKLAISYMRENMGAFKISELAEKLEVNERTLRLVFNKELGTSPKKYYDNIRMQTAIYLLKFTSMYIYEISDKLGYPNQYHFSKAFHNFFGSSPNEYRNNK